MTENEKHNDLLLPKILDNYYTTGLLEIAAFKWIYDLDLERLKFIVKLNDDFIVNMVTLDEVLFKNSYENTIACCKHRKSEVVRDMYSKW